MLMMPLIKTNHVTLLCNGADYFPALLSAIRAAQDEIYLQTYIFELDETGLAVGLALMQAAQRGVFVFLLLDGFGCRKLSSAYIKTLRAAGVEVLLFRPKISPWTFKRSRLRRLHSKLTVIDGRVGFVGGINIIDDFNTPLHQAPRIDYAVKIEGPLLAEMRHHAQILWLRTCRRQLLRPRERRLPVIAVVEAGQMQAAFLIRDNVKHRHDIENAYLTAIKQAQSEVVIANAYFLPGLRFRHALMDAAERGVRVVLLLQKRTEFPLLDFATRALYGALLNKGVLIVEYHQSVMHSKVAVIDEAVALVGSSNIDPFSLILSLEANVAVHHSGFAQQLRQHLQMSIEAGTPVTLNDWQQYRGVKRLFSWLAYGLVKVLIALIGNDEQW